MNDMSLRILVCVYTSLLMYIACVYTSVLTYHKLTYVYSLCIY